MSLLSQPSKLCLGKPLLVRSSRPLSNGISNHSQTPPCFIIGADYCGAGLGQLRFSSAPHLDKKAPMDLLYNDTAMVMIGSSHGWVATLKRDGILRLQDDLNPAASDIDPKRIPLPPLVTLPHCQTQIVTNVSMSSSSPEEEDCVVAVKFLGPQLSYCRPGQSNSSEWTNIRIENPCFYSSRVMFSKKDNMFRIPASSGHLIGSWDLCKHDSKPKLQKLLDSEPKLQKLLFRKIPKLTKTKRELLDSCCTTEYLVESISTGETFLVKQYKKTAEISDGVAKMITKALMVFKLDERGNAVYTQDIGDLCMFISESEPFCVPYSSFPSFAGLAPNAVVILTAGECSLVNLANGYIFNEIIRVSRPFYIPPQDIKTDY